MRLLTQSCCAILIGLAAFAASRNDSTCALTLKLVDAETGETVPGVIRVQSADGTRVILPELLPRDLGLEPGLPIGQWVVLPVEKTVTAPREKLTISGFSGLETELVTHTVDLSGKDRAELNLTVKRFYSAAGRGLRSANTHLHLMKLDRPTAKRYLREVPRADCLDVLFVSHLERAMADRDYISNHFTVADLAELSEKSGVAFGNGEEHRHNFTAQGEGYGHVMLLDLKQLIQPVSIGPGITQIGTDGLPVQRGIDAARRDGATTIWCHNDWGLERIPNWVTGRLDAQNIFDGGLHGSYKDSFYRCLNAGLRVPFSTGTDWFMYDFSRVYVSTGTMVTPHSWLAALRQGRSFITNGPFLELTVAGHGPGDTVSLNDPGSVSIRGRSVGRVDFRMIELVRNGRVIQTSASRPVDGHFEAELREPIEVQGACWLALRIPPPPVKDDPDLQDPVPLNEYGQPLFAHTSPVYVEVAGKQMFDGDIAQALLAEMRASVRTIEKQALFADAAERARVLDVYADAIAALERRIAHVVP